MSSISTPVNTLNQQKTALFVGDLSIFCSESDLSNAFSLYGTILDTKIMRCEETKKNLCYGFVKFNSTPIAAKAMQEMNGKLLCGRPLRSVC
jgi:RNA recognition motif-containing protein